MEEEIWKDVPGYEGVYQASSFGKIRSMDREVPHGNGGGRRSLKGITLKTDANINGAGYMYATLSLNGVYKKLAVHQIIAMAFFGHKPHGYKNVVNHIDGNRLNNHANNIEVVTTRENTTTKFKNRVAGITSDYVGVCLDKDKGRWLASITVNGKQVHLGYHKEELDAHNSYQKALKAVESGRFKEEDFKPVFSNKYKGVYLNKRSGKYTATLVLNGCRYNLGTFDDASDANNAYLSAKLQMTDGTFFANPKDKKIISHNIKDGDKKTADKCWDSS
jgi:hypothetical protein